MRKIMTEHIILFHIGTMKTGSTALQRFLYTSSELLTKWGWCYPCFDNENWAHVNGMFFLNCPSKKTMQDHSDLRWEGLWNVIEETIQERNIIISNEGFWNNNLEDVIEYAISRRIQVKVLVYLRRQDIFLEALYNEDIKDHFEYRDFNVWLQEKLYDKDIFRAHYYKYLYSIEQIIGRENLIVRVFEKEQMYQGKQDIINDFMHIIVPQFDDEIEQFRTNERIPYQVSEINRIFNSVVETDKYTVDRFDYIEMFNDFASLYNHLNKSKHVGYLDKNKRIELIQFFENENKELANRYLNRENGTLFLNCDCDIPIGETQYSKNEQILIQYISLVYMKLNRKLNEMNGMNEGECNFLRRLNELRGKRKLVLFGAGFKCGYYQGLIGNQIDLILDNDPQKQGKKMGKLVVGSPQCIKNWSNYFVIITVLNSVEIERQLQGLGLNRDQDYMVAEEYIVKNSGV